MHQLAISVVVGILIGLRYWNAIDAVPWPLQLGFLAFVTSPLVSSQDRAVSRQGIGRRFAARRHGVQSGELPPRLTTR